MSRKYGPSENTVLARLREAGVVIRPQGYLDPVARQEMGALRAEGWTLRSLGEKYGISRQTVAAKLQERAEESGR